MNVWPPEELTKTLFAIGLPILHAPLVAWDIYASLITRFSNNEVITLGEFGNIFGFSILLLIVGAIVVGFLINLYNEEQGDKKTEDANLFGWLFIVVPSVYLSMTLVIYVLLKLFYKY